MIVYAVTLTLSIEAENEADAMQEFLERVKIGQFEGESLEVEEDSVVS